MTPGQYVRLNYPPEGHSFEEEWDDDMEGGVGSVFVVEGNPIEDSNYVFLREEDPAHFIEALVHVDCLTHITDPDLIDIEDWVDWVLEDKDVESRLDLSEDYTLDVIDKLGEVVERVKNKLYLEDYPDEETDYV